MYIKMIKLSFFDKILLILLRLFHWVNNFYNFHYDFSTRKMHPWYNEIIIYRILFDMNSLLLQSTSILLLNNKWQYFL